MKSPGKTNAQARFRQLIRGLDNGVCRNPHCIGDSYQRSVLSAHHIKYRSHGGDNSPGNGILLCQACDYAVHNGYGKGETRLIGREFMLKILDDLLELHLDHGTIYRWLGVRRTLDRTYGART